ncbi:hypothetical protein P9E76_00385 [Schinkia azotoformans]|uniref:Uncharacterized protein n=1 Tax=Schinkia azotoformans LMG 9581 TaxID=1131731 RepID=K6EAH6_SCHAZ|nr:hypothetical protein [Schinkia azotoformans]EKN70406.1 hypothetical protein BAZO_01372 [Schinkia azotoformans LMG 9581]MEC1640105.1 hypothetical protein [Schinkia azotoformans]MEC1943543.1 hypothetical protein [Schinkia azotoformans]
MQNLNFEIELEKYTITDLNYKFDENILSFLASELSEFNKDDNEIDLLGGEIRDQNTIKVAIHKDLKEMFIIIDTRIEECIDFATLPVEISLEDKEFILRSLDISMKFQYSLKFDNDVPSNLSENEKFMNELQVRLENTIINNCRHHMVFLVRNLTTLDYNRPIKLEFPKFKLENIEIN